MAVKDYTGEFINTLKFFQPNVKPIDFSSVLDNYNTAYDKSYNKTLKSAYSDALASGDKDKIGKMSALIDPEGYAKALEAKAQRAEDRQWALEDQATKQRNALDLENLRNQNARGLAEFKAGIENNLTTKQKDLKFLMDNGVPQKQALALSFGGGTEALGNLLAGDVVGNEYGLTGDALSTYSKEKAKSIVKAEDNFSNALALGENVRGTTSSIRNLLEQDPSIAGAYSGWDENFKKYVKDDQEWLQKRGQLVTELTQTGNFLIKQANDSGVTGINSLSEVERIIKGLTTDSSPAQIKGALDSIDKLSYDLEYKTRNILNGYKKKSSLKEFSSSANSQKQMDDDAWGQYNGI